MNSIYNKLSDGLERLLGWSAFCLMVVIIVAMAAQIFFRFVLNTPLTYTDEIAQISLTWLTFLGGAWIYRSHGHITVDLVNFDRPSSPLILIFKIFGEALVAAILLTLLFLVYESAPLAMRLRLGTLELTRFFMHFLPLALGCVGVCVFAIEHIMKAIGEYREPKNQQTDEGAL